MTGLLLECFHKVILLHSVEICYSLTEPNLSIILDIHLVALFRKSILANSLGECICENTKVLPTEKQGAESMVAKECIGPVPEDDMLMIGSNPNASDAESLTSVNIGLPIGVLYASSP